MTTEHKWYENTKLTLEELSFVGLRVVDAKLDALLQNNKKIVELLSENVELRKKVRELTNRINDEY